MKIAAPGIGHRFGRWVVRGGPIRGAARRFYVPCCCDCGTERLVQVLKLRNGRSRSCGCLQRELAAARHMTHGHTAGGVQHPLYATWVGIQRRCFSRSSPDFRNYGARGVTVCAPWRDFALFARDIERELGPKPTPSHTLDRVDNDGDYEPGNVRWATLAEQFANRRPSSQWRPRRRRQ